MSIPQRWHLSLLPIARQNSPHLSRQPLYILPNQDIRAQGDCHRTLCVLPNCQTRHTQVGRLFLDAARIGDYQGGVALQGQEVEIP